MALFTALVGGAGYIATRSYRRVQNLLRLLHEQNESLLYYDRPWGLCKFQVIAPDGTVLTPMKSGLLVLTEKRLAVYRPNADTLIAEFTVTPGEIRGFWRPVKYHDGINQMWLHAQIGHQWRILKIYHNRAVMADVVRSMKQITTDEQVKAYRRQRPYIHRGPTKAFPAKQNLQGAWDLADPVELYLMPLYLVILHAGEVDQAVDLHHIQHITALARMDALGSDGLLRFLRDDTGQTLAFALQDYEAWAVDLAQAAKRTLEDPVIRKQKDYDEEE